MVDGFSRVIRRHVRAMPHWFPTAAAIIISTVLFGACAFVVAVNAESFVATLGRDAPKLDAMIGGVAGRFGPHAPKSVADILNSLDPMQYLGAVGSGLQDFASNAFLVLVYLGFLIAARHTFERKAVKLFHTRDARHEARHLFLRIRDGLERYLWIQTVLGLVIAGASWLVMMAVGLDNAFFWTFLVFILNYIPIIGSVAAVILPALFALLQFDGWGPAAILLAALLAISFVVGNGHAAAHTGRQPEYGPAGGAAFAGVLGRDLGADGDVPVHAADGAGDGDPGRVRRLALDRRAALRQRRSPEPGPRRPRRPRSTRSGAGGSAVRAALPTE